MGLKFLLFPFQWLFLLFSALRKACYFSGVFKRHIFNIPVICIGNISTGGTGKTPHTKYVSSLLSEQGYSIAILLRGYKRRKKGIFECRKDHSIVDIGDEAMEYMNMNLPDVRVFVAGNRKKGIRFIQQEFSDVQVIIMDDGFQHYRVKPGLSIVLSDYHNLYIHDYVLPIGRLREPASALKRADMLVITKSPKVYSPLIFKDLASKLRTQHDFHMSYLDYGDLKPLFEENGGLSTQSGDFYTIFLLSGIVNPYPLEEHLRRFCMDLQKFEFPDHYEYTEKDVKKLRDEFEKHLIKNKIIVTTEKDVQRLKKDDIKEFLVDLPVYYVPINVGLHNNAQKSFDKKILDYVAENSGNHEIHTGKNQIQP
ncbi:MAG: tetraacyldisaccharide 4'-kinase [Marinilabiliales bacterium]|nr:MAG: tetraacyldisaccharide 4'-kinase [Marinilabiliales bacterium]